VVIPPQTELQLNAALRAATLITQADALLLATGAGMGVDSGLPDFRGPEGFWRAYPALGRAGIDFTTVASPATFHRDPHLAWGFYGHRLALYRRTPPHAGYAILRRWGQAKPHGLFVFTSNVDGQFQQAGFPADRLIEVHGSIHHLQCLRPCGAHLWPAAGLDPVVEEATCRLLSPLPRCPHCGGLARPNILMFGDNGWIIDRQAQQMVHLHAWLATVQRPVVIEIGAGTAVATVRQFTRWLGRTRDARLIRINPREYQVEHPADLGLPWGALEGLRRIDALLGTATQAEPS
jgi:NAD-dependent SIR2 family protein deacetylase